MSEVMQADTAAPRWPGGGHREMADAVAVALDWAAHLPENTVVTSLGFGGGASETMPGANRPMPYWWSAAAVLHLGGGLSSGRNEMTPEEARRFNTRKIVDSAVIFVQAEAKNLAKREG